MTYKAVLMFQRQKEQIIMRTKDGKYRDTWIASVGETIAVCNTAGVPDKEYIPIADIEYICTKREFYDQESDTENN